MSLAQRVMSGPFVEPSLHVTLVAKPVFLAGEASPEKSSVLRKPQQRIAQRAVDTPSSAVTLELL